MSALLRFLCILLWVSSFLFGCSAGSDDPLDGPMPYKVVGDYLAVSKGQSYEPVFLKGTNLAVAVPGTRPGELAASKEDYLRWFEMMHAVGMNCIRMYTLHYPRFYDAIHEFNEAHRESPIYVLHGIWLDEENHTGDLHDMNPHFDEGMFEVVDAAHGNRYIEERPGRASGLYTTDMSKWIIGWLVGREVYADEAVKTNKAHPSKTSYDGLNVRLPKGSPTEVWWAKRLDIILEYERSVYGKTRPVAVSSWPTLDPLDHLTEGAGSHEDEATVDFANLELKNAPAGYFVSFHIYPNYPDFMNDAPEYQGAEDYLGKNPYLGYLRDLKEHYKHIPVMVAEYGISTAWGIAHFSPSKMHHGGLTDYELGLYNARMTHNVHETRYAGAILFAWIDEWWKATWIITPQCFPIDRYPLWHNVMSPEQNYGLIRWDLPPPTFQRWPKMPGAGKIAAIESDVNAEYFFLKLSLKEPWKDDDTLMLGFDTYRDDLGETVLPNGVRTKRRNELALELKGAELARMHVTQAYDLFKIWNNEPDPQQQWHSTATDGAPWQPIRWFNKGERTWKDGSKHPGTVFEAGLLRIRRDTAPATSLDAVVVAPDLVTLRIPWMLLQLTDPSDLKVMHNDKTTLDHETTTTEGIAVTLTMGDAQVETPRLLWERWDTVPATTETWKEGVPLIWEAMRPMGPLP